MTEPKPARISPLGNTEGACPEQDGQGEAIAFREIPFGRHHVLRFKRDLLPLSDDIPPLPKKPNTATHSFGGWLAWIGPDEWWQWWDESHSPPPWPESVVRVDVSHGHTVIEITGSQAMSVLVRGTPIDLHPQVFPMEGATRTHIDKAPVLLIRGEGITTFYLIVRRSFARYLCHWLEAGMKRL